MKIFRLFVRGTLHIVTLCAMMLLSLTSIASEEWEYRVQKNDTLGEFCSENIAFPIYHCVDKLIIYNRLKSEKIRDGQVIYMPVAWLKSIDVSVRVTAFSGAVFYKKNQSKPWQALDNSIITLASKDEIMTKEGYVELLFVDGSRVKINPFTSVTFKEIDIESTGFSKTHLFVSRGSIVNLVQSQGDSGQYKISTPSGVAAVRGTEFRVRVPDTGNSMFSEVIEGAVAVSDVNDTYNNPSVNVEQNFGLKAVVNQPLPSVVELLPAPNLRVKDVSLTVKEFDWRSLKSNGEQYYRYDIYLNQELIISRFTHDQTVGFDFREPGKYLFTIRAIDDKGFEGNTSKISFKL
jgi:hypothetical protein